MVQLAMSHTDSAAQLAAEALTQLYAQSNRMNLAAASRAAKPKRSKHAGRKSQSPAGQTTTLRPAPGMPVTKCLQSRAQRLYASKQNSSHPPHLLELCLQPHGAFYELPGSPPLATSQSQFFFFPEPVQAPLKPLSSEDDSCCSLSVSSVVVVHDECEANVSGTPVPQPWPAFPEH